MSRTSKNARKARAKKQARGVNAGKDDTKKSPYPHLQPKAAWMTPKKGRRVGK